MKKFLVGAVLLGFALAAQAGIVSANFRTESDLPDWSNGALVYERLNATVGSGYELDSSDFVSNRSYWLGGVVWMDLDPNTNILTLYSQDTLDFQTFRASITGITGSSITGITMLNNDLTSTGVVPMLSFTGDSVSIFYDTRPGEFNFTHNTASFQLLTSDTADVPEPESLALLGLGMGALGLVRRRRKQAAA